ncbi:hypothetical protein AGMMS49944_05500 [Spirochaetia bacterium]|nr:hypothetical protein AGMMS49944_05500 [Spirochaetia bacterium]
MGGETFERLMRNLDKAAEKIPDNRHGPNTQGLCIYFSVCEKYMIQCPHLWEGNYGHNRVEGEPETTKRSEAAIWEFTA